jgi:SAM-dependent methyltransferase
MGNDVKYLCLKCSDQDFNKFSTYWECSKCQTVYVCFNGMPKLYLENQIGDKDKSLRDYFYNGWLGKFYQFLMPFLTLPARPFKISKKDWLIYFVSIAFLALLVFNTVELVIGLNGHIEFWNVLSAGILILVIYSFIKHPYFFYLLVLAIPVKLSLIRDKYKPTVGFKDIHQECLRRFLAANDKVLQVLDISTGTGNSLFRHGWMKLNAEFVGLDLSETMLEQCQRFMTSQKVPIDLVIGDATNLPFSENSFDIVLNYGAINGYSSIKKALEEMVRVVKKDGLILFLDEQLYSKASAIEKLYFKKVLSSHNVIHHCPTEFLPADAGKVDVYQVYEFYYICTVQPNQF